ncbi:MAG TPA: response regulator [Gaiellaceae bacterium]|nr:response regulator [Gaiellaceae bacterium]HLM35456.1 response regulator [Gaiellaceae bacterium]
MTLPRGTLTFLFTDVEGSTELLRQLGDDYRLVLGESRAALRAAVDAVGGTEVDARGDELFAVFPDAAGAVEAATRAQRNGIERIRVRIGLHTGTATLSDGAYFGLDVHRAARICSAGHGGQVLLSEAARTAAGAEAIDLGEYRLKGLPQPEHLFQLVAEGLEREFPPLRTESPESELDTGGTTVVLADDSVLLREGTARLLEDAGFSVVGQAGDADDLLLKVRSYRPDVAVVDIRMPPTHTDEGLRAAKEIREKHPDTGVLVLSQYVESEYAMELLSESAEGVGYLLKDRVADIGDFASAVRRVAEGGSALDPTIVSRLVGRRRGSDPLADLTPREREVLEQMAEGRSNKAIASRLVVTERAIEKHVTSIFGKLRLPPSSDDHRRVLAVLAYLHG